MTPDDANVEQTAREFVDRTDAPRILRERAEIAEGVEASLGAEAWRDIADAAERLLT